MAGAWNNGCAHYRCKLKTADARLAAAGHPNSIYVREDKILDNLDHWLDGLFAAERREATVEALYDAGADPGTEARRRAAQDQLRTCDDWLATYRAALEAGADPAMVTRWIAEVTAERTRHEIAVNHVTGKRRLTRDQIAALVDQMAGITDLLRRADPRDRAAVYDQLGLKLTYKNKERLVVAETGLTGHGDFQCVRGGSWTRSLRTRCIRVCMRSKLVGTQRIRQRLTSLDQAMPEVLATFPPTIHLAEVQAILSCSSPKSTISFKVPPNAAT